VKNLNQIPPSDRLKLAKVNLRVAISEYRRATQAVNASRARKIQEHKLTLKRRGSSK
jgi:hypothetical protein